MKKKSFLIIVICLIVISISIIYTVNLHNSNKLIADNSNNLLDNEDEAINFNVGDNGNILDFLNYSEEDEIVIISNSNENIIEIDDNFNFNVLDEGKTTLSYSVNNQIYTKEISVSINTSNAILNVLGDNIDNCQNSGVKVGTIKTENKNVGNVTLCVDRYSGIGAFQNIGISNNYFYVSKNVPSKLENHVYRINRNTNEKEIMKIKYAGHAQSFDVFVNNAVLNGGDNIVMNYFYYDNGNNTPHQGNRGLALTTFNVNNNLMPERAIAISANSLKSIYKESNNKNEKISEKNILNIGNDDKYAKSPQIAVDGPNNRLIVHVGTRKGGTAYVYNMKNYLNGTLNKINSFKTSFFYGQGIELFGNYLYTYGDKSKTVHYIQRYNINNGKVTNYEFTTGRAEEGEGITVYKNKIYIATKSDDNKLSVYNLSGI